MGPLWLPTRGRGSQVSGGGGTPGFVNYKFLGNPDGTPLESAILEKGGPWFANPGVSGSALLVGSTDGVYGNQALESLYYASGNPDTAEYSVQADLYCASLLDQYQIICVSVDNASEVYVGGGIVRSGGFFRFYIRTSFGDQVTSPNDLNGVILAGSTTTIKLSARADASSVIYELFADGILQIALNKSTPPSKGNPGIWTYSNTGSPTTGFLWKNFVARDLTNTDHDIIYPDNTEIRAYNWRLSGSGSSSRLQSNNAQSTIYLGFTGTSIQVNFDYANYLNNNCYLSIRVDGGSWNDQILTQDCYARIEGLSTGDHVLEFLFSGRIGGNAWDTTQPMRSIVVSSMWIDHGASVFAPTLPSKRILMYGDSITENQYQTLNQGYLGISYLLKSYVTDAEFDVVGWAGQGYDAVMQGGTEDFTGTWNYYDSSNSRLSGGVYAITYDAIIVLHGKNAATSATVTSMCGNLRGAAPGIRILILAGAYDGTNASIIIAGYNNYIAANPSDTLMELFNPGIIPFQTMDGVHPDIVGCQQVAAVIGPLLANGQPQITQVDFTGLTGANFNTGGDGLAYKQYVVNNPFGIWFNTGTETQPTISGVSQYLPINITITDSSDTLAEKLSTQLNSTGLGNWTCTHSSSTNQCVITDTVNQVDTPAADVNTGAAITVLQTGVSPL